MTNQNPHGNDENQNPKGTEPEKTGGESQTTPQKPEEGKKPEPKTVPVEQFNASREESLRQKKRADDAEAEIERLKAQDKPITEDEFKQMNPDYEFMTESEKQNYRRSVTDSNLLHQVAAKQKWQEDYASIPAGLKEKINKKGGESAFRAFATKPEYIGMKDIIGLAKLFVIDEEPEAPEPEPNPQPDPVPGLEQGTGGGGGGDIKIRSKGQMTAAEAKNLRQTKPQEYQSLVESGRLEIID